MAAQRFVTPLEFVHHSDHTGQLTATSLNGAQVSLLAQRYRIDRTSGHDQTLLVG